MISPLWYGVNSVLLRRFVEIEANGERIGGIVGVGGEGEKMGETRKTRKSRDWTETS